MTEYRKKLCEVEDVVAPDDLVQGDIETGGIYLKGPGEFRRGEVLMSNGENIFTKIATESDMNTAHELCLLSEDIVLEDDMQAEATGYFFGTYNSARIILPEDMTMNTSAAVALRRHGIYVK